MCSFPVILLSELELGHSVCGGVGVDKVEKER